MQRVFISAGASLKKTFMHALCRQHYAICIINCIDVLKWNVNETITGTRIKRFKFIMVTMDFFKLKKLSWCRRHLIYMYIDMTMKCNKSYRRTSSRYFRFYWLGVNGVLDVLYELKIENTEQLSICKHDVRFLRRVWHDMTCHAGSWMLASAIFGSYDLYEPNSVEIFNC